MNLYKPFLVRHAGDAPGPNGTTRIKLWFDANDTSAFRNFLERQCDAQGVVGIIGTLPTSDEDAKRVLIIGAGVNPVNAAATWIEGVNTLLPTLPEHLFTQFEYDHALDEALAISGAGSNGTFYNGGRED